MPNYFHCLEAYVVSCQNRTKKSCTGSNNLSTNFLSKQNQNLQNFANVTYRLNAQKIGLGIENQALESVKAYKLFDNQI